MADIIVAILGSSALSALISGIFNLIANWKKIIARLDVIEQNQIRTEKDSCRTQLLLLIADYPDDTANILEVAKHYFVDLKGNWYATPIFNRWCEEHNIEPEWFNKGE